MAPGLKGPIRRMARVILLTLLVPMGWIGWNQANHNYAVLQPGRLFRSGQMPPSALSRTLHEQGIRTVLNLRGPNPREAWYRDEIRTTLEAGATQVDIPLSSCVWMSRLQLQTLVNALDTCEYPLIFHCAWGSERTGLTAAIVELLRPEGNLDEARSQLAVRYLYVRLGDGRIMAEFLDQYAAWLRRERVEHSPDIFRHWVAIGYVPGVPSRDEWPYDPSPLMVVTRPADTAKTLAERMRGEAHPRTLSR